MTNSRLLAVLAAGFLTLSGPSAALAEGVIMVKDAYVRSSTPSSPTGAAFMMLMNQGDQDDTLIAASSPVTDRVELHSHTEDANGVMRMGQIEGGILVPAGGMHLLKRGGDHVMFMGLDAPLEQGSEITVTLVFEKAGEVEITVPVDHERRPQHGAMDHSSHSSDK